MDDNTVFALDIGTRKIVGLLMEKNDAGYKIIDSEMIEHSTRAMLDGQIHDVEAVAATIKQIKARLEARQQVELKSAAVAAAGRSLKTSSGSTSKKRTLVDDIDREEVLALELEAVQAAQYQLIQDEAITNDKANYFCVGYSVVNYQLEGQIIGSLNGQRGDEIGVTIIATFLPRVVVDGLFSALKRADLEIYSLTLEPIAALSVAIPPEMRMLNLVLIDIGAGTSDLAIVKNRNIFAYAMVDCAGDELTEKLASEYLLDFNTAEQLKRKIGCASQISISDILGNELLLNQEEVVSALRPVINSLATDIATLILDLNQKAPDAVVCVGGGSLSPEFTEVVADKLGIVSRRVGVRTPVNFKNIEFEADYLKGPQGVTPVGIAFNSLSNPPAPFIKVSINGRNITLWNTTNINVGSALLSAGIAMGSMYGKPGLGKTIEMNGSVKTFKGQLGQAPIIQVNGREADLETELHDGDYIQYKRGKDGQNALVRVSDLITLNSYASVTVNGENVKIRAGVLVNGRVADMHEEVPDRAVVDIRPAGRIDNILRQFGLAEDLLSITPYYCYINGTKKEFGWQSIIVKVNGQEVELTDEVVDKAEIVYTLKASKTPLLRDVVGEGDFEEFAVKVNGEPVVIKKYSSIIEMEGILVKPDDRLLSGASINTRNTENKAILSDVLSVVDINPVPGGRLFMLVDGQEAGFTTPIATGNEIEINWK